eukprot:TRINITY_DN1049_c0_g1_i6.p1 TRINITY_DN1049_c0_g1~~TRINITY_DN1049_c0_g1_i6.p1  ORF type:complete len:690 (+),score=137.65 TRINITY_DN1049_c0_g1_i6:123-2192(+)
MANYGQPMHGYAAAPGYQNPAYQPAQLETPPVYTPHPAPAPAPPAYSRPAPPPPGPSVPSSSSTSVSSHRATPEPSHSHSSRPSNGPVTRAVTPDRPSQPLRSERNAEWGSRSVEIFEKLDQVGEGTYGKVYMAKNKETGEVVALKKIRMDNEKEGFPITAIREIKILKEINHPNIISLKEIVTSKPNKTNPRKAMSIYLVFEYMDHDLTGLILANLWNPSESQRKCYMKQLLEGIHYCHANKILHRDIKGSNLLIDNKGQLKIADFGLARPFSEQKSNYTNRVITLWYRPPELLLGEEAYGPAVDMWSVGCILAEMITGSAIFQGRDEVAQLEKIFKLCGTPDEASWPGVGKLPHSTTMRPKQIYKRCVRDVFKNFSPDALELLDQLLVLDPAKRMTAKDALDSNFFWRPPLPCDPTMLPIYMSTHEFQAKKRRQTELDRATVSRPQSASDLPDTKRQKFQSGSSGPADHSRPESYSSLLPGVAPPPSQSMHRGPPGGAPYGQGGGSRPDARHGHPPQYSGQQAHIGGSAPPPPRGYPPPYGAPPSHSQPSHSQPHYRKDDQPPHIDYTRDSSRPDYRRDARDQPAAAPPPHGGGRDPYARDGQSGTAATRLPRPHGAAAARPSGTVCQVWRWLADAAAGSAEPAATASSALTRRSPNPSVCSVFAFRISVACSGACLQPVGIDSFWY